MAVGLLHHRRTFQCRLDSADTRAVAALQLHDCRKHGHITRRLLVVGATSCLTNVRVLCQSVSNADGHGNVSKRRAARSFPGDEPRLFPAILGHEVAVGPYSPKLLCLVRVRVCERTATTLRPSQAMLRHCCQHEWQQIDGQASALRWSPGSEVADKLYKFAGEPWRAGTRVRGQGHKISCRSVARVWCGRDEATS
jgi:hypothetical protein